MGSNHTSRRTSYIYSYCSRRFEKQSRYECGFRALPNAKGPLDFKKGECPSGAVELALVGLGRLASQYPLTAPERRAGFQGGILSVFLDQHGRGAVDSCSAFGALGTGFSVFHGGNPKRMRKPTIATRHSRRLPQPACAPSTVPSPM